MDAQHDATIDGETTWLDPRWQYPEYPPGSVIEIRVHGVGGAAPDGMTRDPHPVRVGGNDLAGFWRARNPVLQTFGDATPTRRSPVHAREVLAWGGQTSGSWRHALWVLLLPFALFNVAGRMHPAGKRGTFYRAVARVMAYTITLSMTALTSSLAFDLLGAQYRPSTGGAPGGSVVLAPLRWLADDAPARMAVLALLPVLVVMVLWFAGKSRTDELEGVGHDVGPVGDEPVCLDALFWANLWPASRLRAAHATGAFALVSGELAVILADLGPAHQEKAWWMVAGVACLVIAAVGVTVALPSTVKPRASRPLHTAQWIFRVPAVGLFSAMAALAVVPHLPTASEWLRSIMDLFDGAFAASFGVALLAAWCVLEARQSTDDGAEPDSGVGRNLLIVAGAALLAVNIAPDAIADLAGSANEASPALSLPVLSEAPHSFRWMGAGVGDWLEAMGPGLYLPAYLLLVPLVIAQIVLLALVAALGVRRAMPARTHGVNWGASAFPLQLGGFVTALLSLLIVTAVGASLHGLTVEWLGRTASIEDATTTTGELTLPWWYGFTAFVTALVLIGSAVMTMTGRLVVRRWTRFKVERPTATEVAAHLRHGPEGPPAEPFTQDNTKRLNAIGKAWLRQRLIRDAGHLLFVAEITTTAVAVVLFVRFRPHENDLPLATLAMTLITLAAGAAIVAIRSLMGNLERQKHVGVLWDVLNFWPRVTHPFAPRCYGEVIVPLLQRRIMDLQTAGCDVILAGHSQGSVVSAAAVAGQEFFTRKPHLVTYGSPLTTLHERFFPAVFGGDNGALAVAENNAASWHHFFALTEPFAVPVWAETADDAHDQRAGWPASLTRPNPSDACPVCGWCNDAPGVGSLSGHVDYLVSDPDRWFVRLDPVKPKPLGHSTYHRHRELDQHLAHLAAEIVRR